MTEDILRTTLTHALQLDIELREWLLRKLNMSHKATAELCDTSAIKDFTENASCVLAMAHNRDHHVALHLVPVLRNLDTGLGDFHRNRAERLMQEGSPAPHQAYRVALIAPSNLVRTNWQAAREFPYWIDFDALTRRQMDSRAA